MPGVPSSALQAGAEALLIVAFFLALGWLIVDLLLGARVFGSVTRFGLSFAGVELFSTALMCLHMASGGRILSSDWITRGITIAVFVALLARRVILDGRRRHPQEGERSVRGGRRHSSAGLRGRGALIGAFAILCVGLIVWGLPAFQIFPMPAEGDVGALHLGWTTQLLNGEPTPSGFITGDIPNLYPWGYHALLATLTRFTPGARAVLGMAPCNCCR